MEIFSWVFDLRLTCWCGAILCFLSYFFDPSGQNPSISIIETAIVLQEGKAKEKRKTPERDPTDPPPRLSQVQNRRNPNKAMQGRDL
jgi:hypothetical protein